ncbi:MAG TPA: hypothetical protein VGR85_05835 [Candidatus Limnocylindria bacterium]|jgi:hypothetical protein|nr:hypothetical protein [Candidatus Limnocylindria bacterium]
MSALDALVARIEVRGRLMQRRGHRRRRAQCLEDLLEVARAEVREQLLVVGIERMGHGA